MKVSLGIDQIRFILRLPGIFDLSADGEQCRNGQNYGAILEHIHYMCMGDYKKGAKHWKVKKGCMTKSVYPLDDGSVLAVGAGWSGPGQYHLATVQYNVSKLTAVGALEFNAFFQTSFTDGYREFFYRAQCSYIEIFIDIVGAQFQDYVYFDTKLRSMNEAYATRGTLYLGSMMSSHFLRIYDKAKQLQDTNQEAPAGDWLRLEHVNKRVNLPANEVHKLPFPFASLWILDRAKLAALPYAAVTEAFRDRVLNQGLQAQVAYRCAVSKSDLLDNLLPAIPAWYQPAAIWDEFENESCRIWPRYIHHLTYAPGRYAYDNT